MRKYITLAIIIGAISYVSSCKTPESITSKTGVQLWSENCIRCHNAPSADRYSDKDWAVVTAHMRAIGGLTYEEELKIRAFLQSSN